MVVEIIINQFETTRRLTVKEIQFHSKNSILSIFVEKHIDFPKICQHVKCAYIKIFHKRTHEFSL